MIRLNKGLCFGTCLVIVLVRKDDSKTQSKPPSPAFGNPGMWKLTIEDDEGQQTSLSLAVDEYRLGRAESNTIRLTDRNVSRNHAILKKNGQAWVVKDLQSYNGTYVNGIRVVGDITANHGDIVQLGDYRLELINEALRPQPEAGVPAQAPVVPPVHMRPNRLVVVVGPQPGLEFPLDRDLISIGRSEDANISINHSSVSRLHAELIALGNGRFEIIDKGSANGIRVNGVDLRRGILEAGDALELGDVRLRFVGAGKIYRAGIDPSQRLPRDLVPPPKPTISVGKLVGIGIGVGVLLILGYVLLVVVPGSSGQNSSAGAQELHATTSQEEQLLKDAKKLFDAGNIDDAHKKALEISDTSAAREDAIFKQIEKAWADSMFQKADKATDPAEKKRILGEIMTTPSVDAEQRKKAAELHNQIQAAEPTVKAPVGPYSPTGGGPSNTEPSTTGTTAPSTLPSVKPIDGTSKAPGISEEAAMRKSLEPKVFSGKATEQEVRLLKAICSHMEDRNCRDKASAILKKMQEAKAP